MKTSIILVQMVIALSVDYVWIFRFENVMKEFKHFGLIDLTRNIVGATKVSLAALLIAGIWYPSLVPFSALMMGFFMACAQFFHFRYKSSFQSRVPSFVLLLCCLFVVLAAINVG